MRPRIILAHTALILFLHATPRGALAAEQVSVVLAESGIAKHDIVTSTTADPSVTEAANTLADYLYKISGATFTVTTSDGTTGIAIGDADDFPSLAIGGLLDPADSARQDEYVVQSHADGLYLVGATPLAATFAVWDFLFALGYRQYFPTANWEIVPSLSKIEIATERVVTPAFISRSFSYGGGTNAYNKSTKQDWEKKNRVASSFSYNSGHAWQDIMADYPAEFAAHPEFVARSSPYSKFCVFEAGLVAIVLDYASTAFLADPERETVSLARSDGEADWTPCTNSAVTGEDDVSESDRQVYLANAVASALAGSSAYEDKLVTVQAYSATALAPEIYTVEPNVAVTVATAYSPDDLDWPSVVANWQGMGASRFAIREYLDVFSWNFDLPGKSRATRLTELGENISAYSTAGIRYFVTEMGDGWGANGLGYWLVSRLLWEPDATASRIEEWTDDFFANAFGSAESTMREFYDIMSGEPAAPHLTTDLIGGLYAKLGEARSLTTDAGILARINDLVLYVRYAELYRAFDIEGSADAYEALFLYAYRIRALEMVHYTGFFYSPYADETRAVQAKYGLAALTDSTSGLSLPFGDTAFSDAEIAALITDGIANNPLKEYEDVSYDTKLVPAASLGLTDTGGSFSYIRDEQSWFVWVDNTLRNASDDGYEFTIDFTAGRTSADNPASLTIELYAPEDDDEPIQTARVPPITDTDGDGVRDAVPVTMTFSTTSAGLHRLHLDDHGDIAALDWATHQPLQIVKSATQDEPARFHPSWSLYFYVPKGAGVVGGLAEGTSSGARKIQYKDDAGTWTDALVLSPGYNHFAITVPENRDGQLWRCKSCQNDFALATVPPQLARKAVELLLPCAVVTTDSGVADADCDGVADDTDICPAVADTGQTDGDGDGIGDACDDSDGDGSFDAEDCQDFDAAVYPGATETCNATDDDCDGAADEGLPVSTYFADGDADGFGDPGTGVNSCMPLTGMVRNDTDCNDALAKVNPSKPELCATAYDDNCNTAINEPGAGDATTYYRDGDLDTYGIATETAKTCAPPAKFAGRAGDCNDANAAVNPGKVELCNRIDDDCDGLTDEGVKKTFYRDADGDTYGNPLIIKKACNKPSGFIARKGDCDDACATCYPGAKVVPLDGKDNDCDGVVE